MCWERHFHACLDRGFSISRCSQLPPTVPEVGKILRYVLCFPQTWGLFSFPRACANYPKSIDQGIKSVIFKTIFRRGCAERGEDSSTHSTCQSTASGKRNAGLAGIMLIAPLTAKKIYMQAEWKEFIHKSWNLLWLKESIVLSAFYTGELEGGILADVHTHTHTEIVKILGTYKQNLSTFGQDFVTNADCVRIKTQQNFQMSCSV